MNRYIIGPVTMFLLLTVIFLPAAALAGENAGDKYYLPVFFPAAGLSSLANVQDAGCNGLADHPVAGFRDPADLFAQPSSSANTRGGEFTTAENAENTPVAAANLVTLKGPAAVTAGERFSIILSTGESFPRLLSQEVDFFESFEGEAFALIGISNLDGNGKASLELQKNTAGMYHYRVEAGPVKEEIKIVVLPAHPARIIGEKEVFLETEKLAEVEFIIEDVFGNRLRAGDKTGQFSPGFLQVGVKDSDKKGTVVDAVRVWGSPSGNFVAGFTAGKTGDYVVEAFIKDSDVTATTIAHVREFGNVERIELSTKNEKAALLRINGAPAKRNQLELELALVSQYGFKKRPSADDEVNIIYFINLPALADVEKTYPGGSVVLEKGKPGNITVTATYLEKYKGLQDSIEIWIGDQPAQLYFNVLTDGLTAKVEAVLQDKMHQPTFENTKGYAVTKPDGVELLTKNEFKGGKAEFVLAAEEYGSYNISMLTDDGIQGSFMLAFKEPAKPAGHVVAFVGQKGYFKDGKAVEMPYSPYLSYGHVFVPAQFIADIFAAEILPSTAPQRIVFKGKDIEVIVDQGELKLTVIEKGAEKTTPIGPLFLQRTNNVHFVPSVTIGRALGAEVDYLPKEGSIEHVTFVIKP